MRNKCFITGIFSILLIFGLLLTSCEIDDMWPSETFYAVYFDSNGGSGTIQPMEALAGTSITLPNGSWLFRSGYTFDGWNTNSSGTGKNYSVYSSYTVYGDVTLYAKWNPIGSDTPYTVNFNSNGGSGTVQSMEALAGTTITLPDGSGLSKSGYTFGGWNTNSSGTGTNYSAYAVYTVNGNVTLYAKWNSANSGEIITLNPNDPYGWQVIYDQTILNGTQITAGDEYIFKYSFRSNVAMDYLQIVLVDNSASGGGYKWDILSDYIDVEESIPANTVITGEVYFYATGTASSDAMAANRLVLQAGTGTASQPTLTFTNLQLMKADYVGYTYTVTFNSNGGSGTVPLSITANYGDSITLPDGNWLSYSGYTFYGWIELTGGTIYNAGASYTVYDDVTLYAKWNPVSSGELPSAPTGVTAVRDSSDPTIVNITWNAVSGATSYNVYYSTTDSGSGYLEESPTTTSFDSIGNDTTVTHYFRVSAVNSAGEGSPSSWVSVGPVTINTHTVTFDSNEGSAVSSQTVNSGETATRPANPTKAGYSFVNWYSDLDLTTPYNFSTPVTAVITLYAKWEEPGSYALTINYVPDAVPIIIGPTIYIAGDDLDTPTSAAITLQDPSQYSSINWYIPGTGISVSGASITLSADNPAYNTPGEHAVTVEVKINGVPYGRTVIFTVVRLFVVSFDSNGGSGTVEPITANGGESITLPSESGLSRSNYIFDGWNTNSSGTGTNYNASATYPVNDNVTLYAKWNYDGPITSREIIVAMWDSNSDGWDGSAALRINVNGNNLSTNARLASGSSGSNSFTANMGDTVTLYWVSGGQYDYECAFAVYYSDDPPSPTFSPTNGASVDTSGRLLVYRQYRTSGSAAFGNGTLMGSFTVEE